MDKIEIIETAKTLVVKMADISGSQIMISKLDRTTLEDVSMVKVKISNANMSDLEIEGAQMGGAFIHNIGMPPVGNPAYDPNARQRPLRFEHCDFAGSSITKCDLTNVVLEHCDLKGMTINGVSVEEMLLSYKKQHLPS